MQLRTDLREWTPLPRMDRYDSALELNSRHKRPFFAGPSIKTAISDERKRGLYQKVNRPSDTAPVPCSTTRDLILA